MIEISNVENREEPASSTDVNDYSNIIEQIKEAADKIPTAIESKEKTLNEGFRLQASNMGDIIKNPEKITKNPFFVEVSQALNYEVAVMLIKKGYDIKLTFSDDGGRTKISWLEAEEGHIGTLIFYYDSPPAAADGKPRASNRYAPGDELKKLAALWGYISRNEHEKGTVFGTINTDQKYVFDGTKLK